MKYILRSLIFFHRWVGVLLCLVFLLWFPSGIGMMYWGFPSVSAGDRLRHSPKLDAAKVVLSPTEAAEKLGVTTNPAQIRLNSFDGRPVYRFGGGGRGGGSGRIIYADTGEEQTSASAEMLDRIAVAWSGKPLAEATKTSVEETDQWTVAGQLKDLRPMYKYSWPDGQQVYLNGMTGDVVQYTTFWTRVAAHVSAIPHWVYYTPLRKHQPVWINFMIYGSLIGTIGAIVGLIAAVWMYSPKQRYRLNGAATGIPYRGQKRWHWIIGTVFGLATITWTFSGLMSLGPFPLMQRLTGQTPRAERQQQPPEQQQASNETQPAQASTRGEPATPGMSAPRDSPARGGSVSNGVQSSESAPADGERRRSGQGGRGRGSRNGSRQSGSDNGERFAAVSEGAGQSASRGEPVPAGATAQPQSSSAAKVANSNRGSGRRGGGQQGIAGALRGRVQMADFAAVHPKDLLARAANLDVRELEWTSFNSSPLFSANLGEGRSQLLSLDGAPVDGFDQQQVIDIVKASVPDSKSVEIKVIDQYDLYYFDRTRQKPLPVLLVLTHDADNTRYYVDPKSARVMTTYSSRNWVNRWLYTGLHSLNFPFLYNYRPLWDIVVIAFMVGGTALCVTSLVLSWRLLGRKLKRIKFPGDVLTAEPRA